MSYIKNKIRDFGINLIMSTELTDREDGYIEYNKDTQKFSITINAKHGVRRQNFTMAHELAHYMLHREIVMEKGQLDSLKEYTDEERLLERQANIWCANVLMPLQAVRDIIFLNDLDINQSMLKKIADRLEVPEEALKVQMRNL